MPKSDSLAPIEIAERQDIRYVISDGRSYTTRSEAADAEIKAQIQKIFGQDLAFRVYTDMCSVFLTKPQEICRLLQFIENLDPADRPKPESR